MSDSKLDVVLSYWEREGQKDLDGIMDHFHPDATFKAPFSEHLEGTEALREFYHGVISAFADARVEVRRSTEDEDRIAVEFTLRFEQHDGKKGEAEGCNVFTIDGGKIRDIRSYFNPEEFSA